MSRKFLYVLIALTVWSTALADRTVTREYGVATTVISCLPDFTDPKVFQDTWTPVDADVELSKDEGAWVTIGAGDANDELEGCWSFDLSATEMECARCMLKIQDAATQAFTDTAIYINTYGHPNAQNSYGFEPVNFAIVADAAGTTTTTDLTGAASSIDDHYNGYVLKIYDVSATEWYTATIPIEAGSYNGTTNIATHTAIPFAVASGDAIIVVNQKKGILTVNAGIADVNLISSAANSIDSDTLAVDTIGSPELADTAVVEISDMISNVMVVTTIATLATQIDFTLTAGSEDDNAYNGRVAIITDVTTGEQKSVGKVRDYVGSTKQIILQFDPGVFTIATTDNIAILSNEF